MDNNVKTETIYANVDPEEFFKAYNKLPKEEKFIWSHHLPKNHNNPSWWRRYYTPSEYAKKLTDTYNHIWDNFAGRHLTPGYKITTQDVLDDEESEYSKKRNSYLKGITK